MVMEWALGAPEGNIYAILLQATIYLRCDGQYDKLEQLQNAVLAAKSFNEALQAITKATDGVVTIKDGQS